MSGINIEVYRTTFANRVVYISSDPIQAYKDGYSAGLDAAREAVDRLASDMAKWSSAETAAATEAIPDLTVDEWMWAQRGVHRALVAIDALGDKP